MSDDSINQPRRSEDRLARLGQEIDGTTGTPATRKEQRQARATSSRTGRRRKRWSTKRKVVTILTSIAVLLALVVGGSYAYFRYEWNKIHKVACTTCVAAISGKPFNVLIVGSDTRAGNTGQAASSFGTSAAEGGQRSDTIKIVRVDPASGTARVLSIPRDTFVTMSGLAESTGLTGPNKINAAFNNGPNALIETIKNTFGISINHYVVVDFNGVIDSVNALNGISLNFKDPVRDFNTQTGVNESGLDIALPGCHLLSGNQVLSLSRSRYYQYYANGEWNSDNGYDIADPAPEHHHRSHGEEGGLDLQPLHASRLARLGHSRHHHRHQDVAVAPLRPRREVPRLLAVEPGVLHAAHHAVQQRLRSRPHRQHREFTHLHRHHHPVPGRGSRRADHAAARRVGESGDGPHHDDDHRPGVHLHGKIAQLDVAHHDHDATGGHGFTPFLRPDTLLTRGSELCFGAHAERLASGQWAPRS